MVKGQTVRVEMSCGTVAANSESFYKHSAYDDTMRSSKQISITNHGLLCQIIYGQKEGQSIEQNYSLI